MQIPSLTLIVMGLCAIMAIHLPHAAHAQSAPPTARSLSDALALDTETGRAVRQAITRRTRRAIAVGPSAGAALAVSRRDADSDVDAHVYGGLSLVLFAVPVIPDRDALIAMAKDRAMAIAVEQAKAQLGMSDAAPLTSAEGLALAQQLAEQLRDEVLRQLLAPSRRFEKPRFSLDIEGGYHVRRGAGSARLTLGYGLGPLSIGPTAQVLVDDGAQLTAGAELALRLFTGASPRASVITMFLRGDAAMTNRDAQPDTASAGMRIMLDLI